MSRFFDDLERQLRAAATRSAPAGCGWWRRPRNAGLIAIAAIGVATPALARVTGLWQPDVTRTTGPVTVTTSSSAGCGGPDLPPRIHLTDAPVNPSSPTPSGSCAQTQHGPTASRPSIGSETCWAP